MTDDANTLPPPPETAEKDLPLEQLIKAHRPRFAAQLGNMLQDGFDHAGFVAAVQADSRLVPEAKAAIGEHFSPDRAMNMDVYMPCMTLGEHLESGSDPRLRDGKQDHIPAGRLPAPADHPVTQTWNAVWNDTLDHYGDKVSRYEQRMGAQQAAYPRQAPQLNIEYGERHIGASIYLCPMDNVLKAQVSEGFIQRLTPDEQRAVLTHEAQHAIEPVLARQQPDRYFGIIMPSAEKLTHNASSRHLERRADKHAARMGMGGELASALLKMDTQLDDHTVHQQAVMEQLKNHGFALDAQKITTAGINARIELDTQMGVKPDMMVTMQQTRDMQESTTLQTDGLNKAIHTIAAQKPQQEMGTAIDKLRGAMKQMGASHPSTEKRVSRLERLAPPNTPNVPKTPPQHGAQR